MKTSFAKTFSDLSKNMESKNELSDEKQTYRKITDENDDSLTDDIYVVESYNENYESKEMSTLLVNRDLQTEYAEITNKILELKDKLLNKMKLSAGIRKDIEQIIVDDFSVNNFYKILDMYEIKNLDSYDIKLNEIKYSEIFNEAVLNFLNTTKVVDDIQKYIDRYDYLLTKSKYLKKGFNHDNVYNIQSNLDENGFFTTDHYIVFNHLNGSENIGTVKELQDLIDKELNEIRNDPEIIEIWDKIDAKLNKNSKLKTFRDLIHKNKWIILELRNIKKLSKNIWNSYFIEHKDLFVDLLNLYLNNVARLKEIEQIAKNENSKWHTIVEEFNKRFYDIFPFDLVIKNRTSAILNIAAPETEFKYKNKPVDKNIVKAVLSTSEKRALYVLHIIFDINSRIEKKQKTLLILDDVVDSFDYQNKYAIVQYIKEISKQDLFQMIILTHNFDFFRTIISRSIADYTQSYIGYKTNGEIKLKKAEDVRNPLKNWLAHLDNRKIIIPAIPFTRNIIEYVGKENDPDLKILASLLHYRSNTKDICFNELKNIFNKIFTDKCFKNINDDENMLKLILSESDKCLDAEDYAKLENKIILSIAIRLKAEQYMRNKIKQKTDSEKDEMLTYDLFEQYTIEHKNSRNLELLDSVNLMIPDNIHLNSFMYEPIFDMSASHLKDLYRKIKKIVDDIPNKKI